MCVTARMQNASFGEVRDQNALFRHVSHPECGFWSRRWRRVCFSVSCRVQTALFREPSGGPGHRMRFSVRRRHVCAGEEKRILRKDAFWVHALTEKRILRKDAFCVHALTERRNLAKMSRGARLNPREVSESLTSST